ncbi:hypothetical protein B0H16DRAFT_1842312, partial [Mycena metata]
GNLKFAAHTALSPAPGLSPCPKSPNPPKLLLVYCATMLLDIDDADAAVLFAALPRLLPPTGASETRLKALARVRNKIAAEGQRRSLHWVLIDEDVQMGVFADVSPTHLATPVHARPHSLEERVISPLPRRTLFSDTTNTPSTRKENAPVSQKDLDRRPLPTQISPLRLPAPPASSSKPGLEGDVFTSNAAAPLGPPIQLLSPLRLPSPAILQTPTSLLSSPSSTVVASGSHRKRKETSPGEETPTERRTSKRLATASTAGTTATSTTILHSDTAGPARRDSTQGHRPRGAGEPQDDDDDIVVAEARRRRRRAPGADPECPRGGNRVRADRPAAQNAPKTIGEVQSRIVRELNGEEGGEEEGKTTGEEQERWNIHGTPPALSAATSAPIVWLSYLTTSPQLQTELIDLLLALLCACYCHRIHLGASCTLAATINDFHQMMSFIHLALHIQ